MLEWLQIVGFILLVVGLPILLALVALRLVRRWGHPKVARVVAVVVWALVQLIPLWGELVVCPYNVRRKRQAQHDLERIGQALRGYARDHHGMLPASLRELVPNYLPDERRLIDAESGQPFTFVAQGLPLQAQGETGSGIAFDAVIAYSPTWGRSRHGTKVATYFPQMAWLSTVTLTAFPWRQTRQSREFRRRVLHIEHLRFVLRFVREVLTPANRPARRLT